MSAPTGSDVPAAPPVFFVLMATKDRCDRLPAAIDSVLAQSYPHWRLFVQDDGSTDETQAVLGRVRSHPGIDVGRFERNRGANAARNAALERILARGEAGFLVILDDDDVFEPDALAGFAAAIERQPDQRWFIARCRDHAGRSLTRLRGRGLLCYLRDHKCGSRLAGEVVHAIDVGLIRDTRFPNRFANAEEWGFFGEIATRSRIQPLDHVATRMTLLPDGLTHSHLNRHRALEVYELKYQLFAPMLLPRQRARLLGKIGRHAFRAGDFDRIEGLIREAVAESILEPRIALLAIDLLRHRVSVRLQWLRDRFSVRRRTRGQT